MRTELPTDNSIFIHPNENEGLSPAVRTSEFDGVLNCSYETVTVIWTQQTHSGT